MTMYEYLNDPRTKSARANLDKEFESIVKRFSHHIYTYRDYVIYHILVPSTKPGDTNYDVIIEIRTSTQHSGYGKLDKAQMRVFSNCPSFVFRIAYILGQQRNIPTWIIDKLGYEAIAYAPKQPPENLLEKSLYFALKYIQTEGLDNNSVYKTTGTTVNFLTDISRNVRTQREILDQAEERIERQRELRRQEKQKASEEAHDDNQSHGGRIRVRVAAPSRVPTTGLTKKENKVPIGRKIRSVLKTKHIKRF